MRDFEQSIIINEKIKLEERFEFRTIFSEEAVQAASVERVCFPPNEACTEEMMKRIKPINKESTISVTGLVRERESKNPKLPTGEIEVVPAKIEVLGRCRYNELPFEINRSRDADETQRAVLRNYRETLDYLAERGRRIAVIDASVSEDEVADDIWCAVAGLI